MNFYEDKIEAYLTGKISAADKISLEEGMNNDPLLKGEVDLQRDIIESLKNSRKLQLKNRLNNIDVTTSATTGVSSAVKIAASLITVGMIGAGVYYLSVFPSKDKEQENVSVVVNEVIASPSVQNSDSQYNNSNVVANNSAIQADQKNSKSDLKNNSNKGSNNSDRNQIIASPQLPNAEIPSETENFKVNNAENPDEKINDASSRGKTTSIDTEIKNDKNDFSYSYSDNKLYLYGDFSEQPYNLVEINSPKGGKRLFLLYDNKYYELKANQVNKTKLKVVKDDLTLRQLNNK